MSYDNNCDLLRLVAGMTLHFFQPRRSLRPRAMPVAAGAADIEFGSPAAARMRL
jgi:hypothetical protein